MSLQMPGAVLYLLHWSFGGPSASGPRNAFARARTVLGVIPALPALASLRNRTVVSISPKATMCQGSGAFFSALYLLITALYAGKPLSVGSPYSDETIAYVHSGQSPRASITCELRQSGAVMIFLESVIPSCWSAFAW